MYETGEGFLATGSMLDALRDEAGRKDANGEKLSDDSAKQSPPAAPAARKTRSTPKSDDRQRKLFDDF